MSIDMSLKRVCRYVFDSDRSVCGYHSIEGDLFFFLHNADGKITRLEGVSSPIDFTRIPASRIAAVFKHMFPRLKRTGEGDHRLSFHLRLSGGMWPDGILPGHFITDLTELLPAASRARDDTVRAVIEFNLSRVEGLTSVEVRVETKEYTFTGGIVKTARVITIKPYGSFAGFFTAVKRYVFGVKFVTAHDPSIDLEAIKRYVLGKSQSEEEKESAEACLKKLYKDRRGFTIVISADGQNMQIQLEEDQRSSCSIM